MLANNEINYYYKQKSDFYSIEITLLFVIFYILLLLLMLPLLQDIELCKQHIQYHNYNLNKILKSRICYYIHVITEYNCLGVLTLNPPFTLSTVLPPPSKVIPIVQPRFISVCIPRPMLLSDLTAIIILFFIGL